MWTVDYNNSEEFEAAIKTIMRTQVLLGGGGGVISPLLGLQGQIAAVVAGAQLLLLSVNCFSFPLEIICTSRAEDPPLLQLQGDSCSPLALKPSVLGLCPGQCLPLRDPLGILQAELEQGEAEIREMRFGTRRLRLLEMRGSAVTWRAAKINPEGISLQVP